MRVLLAGGGSGGSAAPVIAVAETLRDLHPDVEFLYIGTRTGPERDLVESAGLPFASVSSGRLRRYRSWRNLVDPALVLLGIGEAGRLVAGFRPHVAFGAGGFATVPPLLAARAMGARVMIHQQDAVPSLANRILAPFATKISVAFPESTGSFLRATVGAVGNPVRRSVFQADPMRGRRFLDLEEGIPLVLAMGGGTGALSLNRIVADAARELCEEAQVVHLTGAGKAVTDWSHARYRAFEFLTDEFPDVLAAANVVVSRSGMSSLAEIGARRKAAIVVPMPNSHQEANAALLQQAGAAVVRAEAGLTSMALAGEVRALLNQPEQQVILGEAAGRLLPADAGRRIADELSALA